MSALYKNVQTYYYLDMKKTPIAALVAAEIISILGSRMTYLALPWFVLVTTGSAAKMSIVLAVEILPMAIFGIPSGMVVERLGARTTMLACDAARVPLLVALPILHAAGILHFSILLALVFLLGCFMAPYFAAQRVILPELVGEDETTIAQANSVIEGGTAFAGTRRPGSRRDPDPDPRRAERPLRRRRHVRRLVPAPGRLRAANREAGRRRGPDGALAGIKFLLRDKLLGPLSGTRDRAQLPRCGDVRRAPVLRLRQLLRRLEGRRALLHGDGRRRAARQRRCRLRDQAVPADQARRARDRRDVAAALAAPARASRPGA